MLTHSLGCSCRSHVDRPWNRAEHWSPAELDYLERWYGRRADAAIAKHLGRSVVALNLRAKRAGLHKRDAGLSSREVGRIFGVDESIVSKVWIHRGLLAAKRAAFRQGPHRMWLVEAEAIDVFIREHGQYVDVEKMPASPYRDLASVNRWYSLPHVQYLTGRDQHSLSTSIRRGVYQARKRGTHWYVPQSELPKIQARVLRVGRWTTLAAIRFDNEARLERRRNRRNGVAA